MIRGLLRGIAHHRIWAAVVVIALAGGGTAAYLMTRDSQPTASTASTYRVVDAALGTVRESVSTTGTLEPATQDSLSFQVSGKVTSVRVAAGDKVKKGQVLATVNSAALKASLAQARASLANARAALVSAQDADASDAQIAADKAAVSAAKESVTSAKQALADRRLKSPITGQIASVDLAVGDEVTGSGSSGSGSSGSGSSGGGQGGGSGNATTAASTSSSTAQFLVISTTQWTVTTSVDATEVGLIAKGDQAQLTIDGVTDTVYGTISSVGVIASSSSSGSSSSASYPVEVAVTGNPTGLHAGTSATVALIYKQLSNVLTVPSLAVSQVNGASVVYVSATGEATGTKVMKKVTTGLSSGGTIQIKSGLTAGDAVLVQVPTRLNRGTTTGTGTGTRGGEGGGFGGGFGGGGTGNFGGGGGTFGGGGGNFGGGAAGGTGR